ncbi:Type II secretion system (T2SS), protein F [uncultured archaeon]|nr:Type II secretion system (T2SS), protein F [uncultured archaeon]
MELKKLIKLKLNKIHVIGVSLALAISILSYFFIRSSSPNLFYFILGIAFVIGGFPFFVSLIMDSNITREKDEMFLEFSRNLVESVRAGTPISRSIINIKTKDFGSLNPYIDKLANQISLGIPLKAALETFARDAASPTITRAVTIISESEKAGGEIEDILESVAASVAQVEKLRKERRAAMYSLVVQGYIIFLIFIVIMLVMQFKILPIASGLGEGLGSADSSGVSGIAGMGISGGKGATVEELSRPFLWLLLVQGFFAGLVIGKISEGEAKNGLKHSFILLVMALLIYTGSKLFLGK